MSVGWVTRSVTAFHEYPYTHTHMYSSHLPLGFLSCSWSAFGISNVWGQQSAYRTPAFLKNFARSISVSAWIILGWFVSILWYFGLSYLFLFCFSVLFISCAGDRCTQRNRRSRARSIYIYTYTYKHNSQGPSKRGPMGLVRGVLGGGPQVKKPRTK